MSRLLALVCGGGEHAPHLRGWLNNATVHNYPVTKQLLESSLFYRASATPVPPSEEVAQLAQGLSSPSCGPPSLANPSTSNLDLGADTDSSCTSPNANPEENVVPPAAAAEGMGSGVRLPFVVAPGLSQDMAPPGVRPQMMMPPGGNVPDMSGLMGGMVPDVSGSTAGMVPDVSGSTAGMVPDMSGLMAGMVPDMSDPMAGMPPSPPNMSTESLLIPVFRRDRFVLGELYGEVSPNAMALSMISGGPLPKKVCRRFCVDLSTEDSIEFVEYEWFSDGKVIISMHDISPDGNYAGQSVVLDVGEEELNSSVKVGGLSNISSVGGGGMRVIMRIRYSESVTCDSCSKVREACMCGRPFRVFLPRKDNELKTSWSAWVDAFHKTRTGSSLNKVEVAITTPIGEMPAEFWFRLSQSCETGADSGVSLLRRKYAERSFIDTLSPAIEIGIDDSTVFDSIDRVATEVLDEVSMRIPLSALSEIVAGSETSRTENIPQKILAPTASKAGNMSGRVTKKSFPCPTCDMIFTHRGHLNVHVLTRHLKLRPFACAHCSSSFAKRSDLRRHSKALHKTDILEDDKRCDGASGSVERPFKCDLCDRHYATRQGRRKHRANKHEGEPLPLAHP